MLGFPASTEFNTRIPKQKFYEKMDVSPALKRIFIEQIKMIYWRNKLAPATLNLAPGERVTEIEVFEIKLQQPSLDEAVLKQIDKEIPYHILFVLTYDDKCQAWIGYKEASDGNKAFKVIKYYHTPWISENELLLKVKGLNLDAVYDILVRQIGGEVLETNNEGETLQESVARDERRLALEKQIATLEAKMRKEKQLNRQMEINAELKKLRALLNAL